MAAKNSLLERLISLPGQADSEDRRVLLREITDVMAAAPDRYTRKVMENFDQLLHLTVPLIDRRLRRALAMALTKSNAPKELVKELLTQHETTFIQDLRRSSGQTAGDLLSSMREQSGVKFPAVTDNSAFYPENRLTLPRVFLETIYSCLFHEHRNLLLERIPASVENVLDRTSIRFREHILTDSMNEARDQLLAARKEVMARIRLNNVDEDYMSELLETGHRAEFLFAFAHTINTDIATTQRILNDQTWESLAIACASAGLTRNFFARMLHAMQRRENDERFVLNLIAQYGKLQKDMAERVMRFLQIRTSSIPEGESETAAVPVAKSQPVAAPVAEPALQNAGFGRKTG